MAAGAAAALFDDDLNEAEVMDLVPVRPLAAHEADIAAAYRTVLPALYEKLAVPDGRLSASSPCCRRSSA